MNLDTALVETAGVLPLADYPDWNSPQRITAWVKNGQQEDKYRLERKLRVPEMVRARYRAFIQREGGD